MKQTKRFITTMQGMSGHFAVEMWLNETGEHNLPPFWEPWDTGLGRYATKEDAVLEAKAWAEEQEMEYRP